MNKYGQWLQESNKQAQKEQREKARTAAACLLRGIRLMCSASVVNAWNRTSDRVYFDDKRLVESPEIYDEFYRRATTYIKTHLISDSIWEESCKEVEKLSLSEIIALSRQGGLFDRLAPDGVLVSDIMQS